MNNTTTTTTTMFLHTSISSFPSVQYAITIDLISTIILCSTIAICFVLIYNILLSLVSRLQDIAGLNHHNAIIHDHARHDLIPIINNNNNNDEALFHRSLVQYNVHFIDALERFVRDIDEQRWQRLRDLKKLPPLISYCGRGKRSSSSSYFHGGGECVICLEDFEDGESCQVFPVCRHIFHTNCIDHWLKNRPTCPVCRHCILEV